MVLSSLSSWLISCNSTTWNFILERPWMVNYYTKFYIKRTIQLWILTLVSKIAVILGPNGAGKSTIVNGIALALGAKTSVLGRAEHIVDFIRTGCESATLDIEIYNELEEANYLIRRKIFKYIIQYTYMIYIIWIWISEYQFIFIFQRRKRWER